ncbi:MAG: aldo/keto reductase [Bacillota bacterium]
MIYRTLGKTNLEVSVIGLGAEHLTNQSLEATIELIDAALATGINIIDVFMPQPAVRDHLGAALRGRRERVILQGHIGTACENGQYERTRDLAKVKAHFEDYFQRLGTDYIDIGMIHYVDTDEDYQSVFESEIIHYAQELKQQGRIRFIGMSSHAPAVALKAVESGLIDILMFSINPAYDLGDAATDVYALMEFKGIDQDVRGMDPTRAKLYATCERLGVGITVMKALGAGLLLNAEQSPFGQAMTVAQCCHYALSRPGVASVLVGCKNPDEVRKAAGYVTATAEERDYSLIAQNPKHALSGQCVYCNHCLPCPSQIDIATVHKYLDLATVSGELPDTVRGHYALLDAKASDCIECGSCEPNCPFGVQIIENMRRAREVFK